MTDNEEYSAVASIAVLFEAPADATDEELREMAEAKLKSDGRIQEDSIDVWGSEE